MPSVQNNGKKIETSSIAIDVNCWLFCTFVLIASIAGPVELLAESNYVMSVGLFVPISRFLERKMLCLVPERYIRSRLTLDSDEVVDVATETLNKIRTLE